ncbi:MAG: class I SAM-dependent RNA methyltransferase [Bacilli bacterium]
MKEKILITGIDHYGRGIGKLYNKVIFIANALIGEEVECLIVSNKKNYCEGKVINYLKKSTDRVNPMCRYYDICGGCNIMHMNYNNQLKFKENKLKEILNKFALVDEKVIKPIIKSDELYYRNKITLQVKDKLGLYEDKSYKIVNINKCIISNQHINDIIEKLNELDLSNINQIVIRSSEITDQIMIILCIYNKIVEKIFIDKLSPFCTSLIKKYKNEYKVLHGNNFIVEELNNYKFKISADSFFQVNTKQAIKMYDLVKKYCGNNILDLYCGTGTIGIYANKNHLTGIEMNQYAIKDAIENAKINGVSAKYICDDVKNSISKINTKYDTIIIDPPRNGLDNESINNILKINPLTVIYVSCDPVTLARDLNCLKKKYNIVEIVPFDMFPSTFHVECVCVLNRC